MKIILKRNRGCWNLLVDKQIYTQLAEKLGLSCGTYLGLDIYFGHEISKSLIGNKMSARTRKHFKEK